MPTGSRAIQAVVFDLDDTLLAERDFARSGFRAVAGLLRRRLRRRERFEDWMWRRFRAGQRSGMFDALSARFDLHLTPDDIRALVELFRNHRPSIHPARGVRALLAELRRRGLRLGLLSDGYLPSQRLKLRAVGLARCFDAVVFTEDLGRSAWKPSTKGFELLRRALGVPHSACAYVADNPGKDFLPGNRLGWRTIQWLRRGQLHSAAAAPPGGRPQLVVRSCRDLLKALR